MAVDLGRVVLRGRGHGRWPLFVAMVSRGVLCYVALIPLFVYVSSLHVWWGVFITVPTSLLAMWVAQRWMARTRDRWGK